MGRVSANRAVSVTVGEKPEALWTHGPAQTGRNWVKLVPTLAVPAALWFLPLQLDAKAQHAIAITKLD